MLNTYLLLAMISISSMSSLAQTRSFQTARLTSTAGAGVASVSLLDSAVLNPASIGFYNKSAISYQQNRSEFGAASQKQKFTNHALIAADTGNKLKGTFSYFDTEDINFKQKAFGLSVARLRTKLSSFGLGYRYKRIKNKNTGEKDERHILTLGNSMITSKNFSMGFTVADPFNANSFEHRVTLGVQSQLASSVYLMADALTNQRFQDFSDTLGWKAAIQIKAMKKVFFRVGYSKDKKDNIKETGFGIDIKLAKLSIGAAVRTTKILDQNLTSILSNNTESKDFVIKASARY